jgi:hypothetical protein
MPNIILSRFTNDKGVRVGQVIVGGVPICAETTPEIAAEIASRFAQECRLRSAPVYATAWDGDTSTETEVEL